MSSSNEFYDTLFCDYEYEKDIPTAMGALDLSTPNNKLCISP